MQLLQLLFQILIFTEVLNVPHLLQNTFEHLKEKHIYFTMIVCAWPRILRLEVHHDEPLRALGVLHSPQQRLRSGAPPGGCHLRVDFDPAVTRNGDDGWIGGLGLLNVAEENSSCSHLLSLSSSPLCAELFDCIFVVTIFLDLWFDSTIRSRSAKTTPVSGTALEEWHHF